MTTVTTTRRSRARGHLRFALHYAEMVVAMLVGMFALDPVWSWAWPGLAERPAAATMVMATNMALAMALWMRVRKHSWPRIAEMSAAMYAPFLVLLAPYAGGWISADALMMGGHILMFPAMLAAMLWRLGDYYHHHH